MILFYVFLAINLFSFLIIFNDKNLAKKKQRRISKKTLLAFVLIGGTLGSGLGMLIFRHKTAKKSYLLKFWLIVIQQLLVIWFYFNRLK